MNKKTVILCLISLLVLMSGCSRDEIMPSEYVFLHSLEEIDKVELLSNGNPGGYGKDESRFILITQLQEEEIVQFMDEVYALKTSFCISPPPRGYGAYIAKITYSNGDIEMLGTAHIEYIEFGSEPTGVGAYYFTDGALEKLILKYCSIRE